MALSEGVGPGVAALGLTTADVAAGGAESEVEPAAAFLTTNGLRLRKRLRHVLA